MPSDIRIHQITSREDPVLLQLEALFRDMYAYMERHGLNIKLADGGSKTWIESVSRGLGRFGTIYAALAGDEMKGFAHGSIRLTPDYLGNHKVGVITHIYVLEDCRGDGVGEKLVGALEKWFKAREVHSVELQVLALNEAGIAFWEKLGYDVELYQHRKAGDKL